MEGTTKKMEENYTMTMAEFCASAKVYDLPANVIHETKRILLDILGCALGAVSLDKGRIATEVAEALGGKPEATLLGTGRKASVTNAAFANGELMHGLDFCPLLPPAHVTPFVTSSTLALAESRKATGRELILALALAHEVASRIGASLGTVRGEKGKFPARSYGFGGNTFGAAAGAAKILKLDTAKTADTLGIAGYFAPIPTLIKWINNLENALVKYGSAGWMAQAGVTAALLAERGYQGDKSVLDGDYGFWAMNGSESCSWEKITQGLGKDWLILKTTYKYWPCCGIFGPCLDAFHTIIEKNHLQPDEIEKVVIKSEVNGNKPRYLTTEINSHVDAQMSLPYNIAVAAHRVKVGPQWQAPETTSNPQIKDFMKKVGYETYPRCDEARHEDLVVEGRPFISRRPAYAEVTAKGGTFTHSVEYSNWQSMDAIDFRAPDTGLADKFRANAEKTMKPYKIEKAISAIFDLEDMDDVSQLMKLFSV